ncbi:MAG: hypothetical protein OEV66_05405 [Spirochaetia bacterium]|nr:hypothetical protein [Spirochaetia bacterium]
MATQKYQTPDLSLSLEVQESPENIKIVFTGKSKAKSPSDFLNPVMQEVFANAIQEKKSIFLDFFNLEYMNSATVSPIIKFWAKLKDTGISLTVEYNGAISWQKTNFSALTVFEKDSQRFILIERQA